MEASGRLAEQPAPTPLTQKDEKGPCRSHSRAGLPDHHDPRVRRLRMIPTIARQASRAFQAWTSGHPGLILRSGPAHSTLACGVAGLARATRPRRATTTRDARRYRPSLSLSPTCHRLDRRAARRTGFGPLRRVGAEGHRDAVSCHDSLHCTSTQRRVEFDASDHTVDTKNDVSRRVRRIL